MPVLHHLNLPLSHYGVASKLQSILFRLHLLYKTQQSKSPSSSSDNDAPPLPGPPPPYLITAEFFPTYTFGRREKHIRPPEEVVRRAFHDVTIAYTSRGGQTTFHGPGQVVAYPIIDLKVHDFTPRGYICFLERSIINVLADGKYGIKGFTTDQPGVWVTKTRKIASVGVNLRRWVSCHGLSINVNPDLSFFEKIVPCGLDKVTMWSMRTEIEHQLQLHTERLKKAPGKDNHKFEEKAAARMENSTVANVRGDVVAQLVKGLGCSDCKEVTVQDVVDLGKRYGINEEYADGENIVEGVPLIRLAVDGREVQMNFYNDPLHDHIEPPQPPTLQELMARELKVYIPPEPVKIPTEDEGDDEDSDEELDSGEDSSDESSSSDEDSDEDSDSDEPDEEEEEEEGEKEEEEEEEEKPKRRPRRRVQKPKDDGEEEDILPLIQNPTGPKSPVYRGRPRKAPALPPSNDVEEAQPNPAAKRGRPRKTPAPSSTDENETDTTVSAGAPPRPAAQRGRPKKSAGSDSKDSKSED
ncbi:hypothetical protein Dda_0231 [Drechslerella dactyloides]|uniref:lipoyl(octanoyl) transferase n=1 Tax=Drechslerella dactyloides TaxID=74499 RepID=A0AAD6J691_DREDA|nr:hypothetical protein Dda_0231 [Drechslerella dactyloides]